MNLHPLNLGVWADRVASGGPESSFDLVITAFGVLESAFSLAVTASKGLEGDFPQP